MTRFFCVASALASAAASLVLALPAAAEHAAASSSGAAKQSDPSDAVAAVPPVGYRSAFSGYRPLTDDKLGWKEANDEVGRIGGWRTYARQANAPEPAASAAPRTAPEKPAGHGAHGNHGTANKK